MGQAWDIGADGSDTDTLAAANRFQARQAVLVDQFRHVIAESTVLLLGAGNGQLCIGYAAADARHVIGVEADHGLAMGFSQLPDIGLRERIEMRCADPVTELRAEVTCQRQQDIVVLLDILEGQSDLHDVFRHVVALSPRLVIVDGTFANTQEQILLLRSGSENAVNAPFVPSLGALYQVARDTALEVTALDWNVFDEEDRTGLSDYYAHGRIIRASFAMHPVDQD